MVQSTLSFHVHMLEIQLEVSTVFRILPVSFR